MKNGDGPDMSILDKLDLVDMDTHKEVVSSKGYTRYELENAFDSICNKENWKYPFICDIPYDEYELYNEACIFYTGAVLNVLCTDWITNKSLCECKGYYETIGA